MTPPVTLPTPRTGATEVVVLGVLPPPVTGMSLCTERVAQALEEVLKTTRLNLSNGSPRIDFSFRFRKFLRACAALAKLAFKSAPGEVVVYMSLNVRRAMYYNLAATLISWLRGFRVVMHHHGYNHLVTYNWKLAAIDRLMGPQSAHLLLCPHMVGALRQQYNIRAECRIVPSTIMLSETAEIPAKPSATFRLGHLSNLSHAKGIDYVIDTFERLRADNQSVSLMLAGPATDREAKERIAACLASHPNHVRWIGPVYDADKDRFFREIDVFLLPSRNEAQPVVISEAFAFGKPVIAFGRSCIPGLLGDNSPGNVSPEGDFVAQASQLVKNWIANPESYQRDSQAARRRSLELIADARQRLQSLRDWILNPAHPN